MPVSRTGDIAFAVRTPGRFYGYRPDHVEWSASVVKAMLMVAYLDRPSVARRPLNGYDTSLLVPMITHSDNSAASTVDGIVGNAGLQALANRVGMTHFRPVMQPWGETQITARDQTKFFLHIDALHRGPAPLVRDPPAGLHHAVAALGDRHGCAARLGALL